MPANLTAKVFKNTLVIFVGRILYLLLGFAWSIKLSRYLQPEGFGVYSSVYAYVAFFELLTNSGIETVLVRKIAVNPQSRDEWVWHGLLLRAGLAFVAWVLALAGLCLLPADKMPIGGYAWIACFGIFLSCFTFFSCLFQAELKMVIPVLGSLISGILFLAATFYLAFAKTALSGFIAAKLAAFLLGGFFLAFWGWRSIKKVGPIKVPLLKTIFMESLPFFFSSVFILIYYRIDVMMVGWMKGQEQVGYYAAAFRLSESLSIVPGALMMSLFPIFSREAGEGSERLIKGYHYSLKYLFILILPIAVGTTLLSSSIIDFFFKQAYLPSATVLSILIWAVVFNFIGYVLSYLLMAMKLQYINAWTNVAMVVLNVGLNLILIPLMGFNGAGVATVATEAFSVVVWFYIVTKTLKVFPRGWFLKPMLAALLMGVLLYWLGADARFSQWPLYARLGMQIAAGVACYALGLLGLKVFKREDRDVFRRAFMKG